MKVVERESGENSSPPDAGEGKLPEWFNVYEGLTDEEIDRLEEGFETVKLREAPQSLKWT